MIEIIASCFLAFSVGMLAGTIVTMCLFDRKKK